MVVLSGSRVENALIEAAPERAYQFERQGYFCRDSRAPGLVFNRVIGLRDSFAKESEEQA